MKVKMIALCLVLGSWAAQAQHDHTKAGDSKTSEQNMVMFKDARLGTVYTHYLHVKDALVASNAEDAGRGAAELAKALKEGKGSSSSIETATRISGISDITEQRKLFSLLSNELATMVKGGKLSMGMVYVEYCPMANNNSGAYWLSNEKEIKNPYFGAKMLKCGSVKEMIH